jgi:RimJ/RimL family protein N-acetyltransferase
VVVSYACGALKLRRLVNSVSRANRASLALMRRLGFRLADNLKDPDFVVGILDREDWAPDL